MSQSLLGSLQIANQSSAPLQRMPHQPLINLLEEDVSNQRAALYFQAAHAISTTTADHSNVRTADAEAMELEHRAQPMTNAMRDWPAFPQMNSLIEQHVKPTKRQICRAPMMLSAKRIPCAGMLVEQTSTSVTKPAC